MTAFTSTAATLAPIVLALAAIAAAAWVGIKAADRWNTRFVARMVDDGLAALTAEDIAADTLRRVERDPRRRRGVAAHIQWAVDAAAFDRAAAQIRNLPEIQERRHG